ncbi:MAG: p21 activated protein kinase inhibitor Skb15 [Amphiamblys sp. WSBS2006]|nr:MAG: p21 activated protein kinase inhibitor Skb15 [Amphiamblys sp. WSBS2006]
MECVVCAGTYEKTVCGIVFTFRDVGGSVELEKAENIFSTAAHSGSVTAVAMNRERTFLVSGSTDEMVNVFDVKRRRHYGTLEHHVGTITDAVFFGDFCFVSSRDGTVSITNTERWCHLHTLNGHKEDCVSFAVHPSGKVGLSVGGTKRHVKVWNLSSAKMVSRSRVADGLGVSIAVRWSATGRFYGLLFEGGVQVFSKDCDEAVVEFKAESRLKCFLFYRDTHVLLFDEFGGVAVIEIETGKHTEHGSCNPARIKAACVVGVGVFDILFTASSDGTVKVWDMQSIISPAAVQLGAHRISGRINAIC